MREVQRVLKPGGLARLQLNGLPLGLDDQYTTWSGAPFSQSGILAFAPQSDLQVLVLEGVITQYMWTTWRKQPKGWQTTQDARTFAELPSRIRRIANANISDPLAPSRG